MKIEHLVLFLVYSFFYQTAFCQQSSTDSLEAVLIQATDTDKKISLFQALILEYSEKDIDQVVNYCTEILSLLSSQSYQRRGEVYHYLGKTYTQIGRHEQAFACADSALHCFERTGNQEGIIVAQGKKWNTCRNLVVFNMYKATDKAMKYAHLLLKIASDNNNHSQMGESHSLIGAIHGIKHQTDRSFEYFDSAVYYLKKTDNQREIARTYNHIGTAYKIIRNYNEASKWLYKSLEVYDSLQLPSKIGSILSNLAAIDIHFKDYPAAIEKQLRAIDIHTNMNKNPTGAAIANLNISNTYVLTKEWDKALIYINKAISLFIELNEYGNLIIAYVVKTKILKNSGQLKLAQQSIQKAIELKEHAYNQDDLLNIYLKQAQLFFETKDYSQSITSFNMILDSAEHASNINMQIGALHGLMNSYTASKNFEKAYECSTKLLIVNDSLIAQNNQKNIKDIEIKYNTEKKEQENQLLLKEKELQAKDVLRNRQLFYLSIGLAFLIFIISILVLRQYKLTATATNNQLKSRLLRNQMSPHFLFNSLVAIQSFVYSNNPLKAGDYLSSFATLMRAILDNSSKEYITLDKEIEWLENYLGLQLLRFQHKFEYHLDLDPNIEKSNTLIPPMLIQPFIENALEHGLNGLSKKGVLSIKIQQFENEILIEVQDNGLGLSKSDSALKKHESHAIRITQERLKFLNKKQAKKIHFEITSAPNQGTLVAFKIPFNSKF